MITGFASLVLNIALNFVLIRGIGAFEGLGFVGAALSTTLCRAFSLIALWAYVYFLKPDGFTWSGWQVQAYTLPAILEFLKYGVPSSLMFWLEETSFNLMTLLVGLLHSRVATVTAAIGMSVMVMSFILPISFGSAAASRIGFLLGANRPRAARSVTFFCLKAGTVLLLANGLALFLLRRGVINLFLAKEEQTDDVIDTAMAMLTLVSLTVYVDGQQIIAGCLIRGVGFPTAGFLTNLFAHYVVANPLGSLLAFALGVGVMGFYIGLTIGLAAAGVIYIVILYRVDWEQAALQAHQMYSIAEGGEANGKIRAVEIDIVPATV